MALETLTGKWTGKYVYGESYGFPIAGTTVRFDMELRHDGYRITGTCTDDEHKRIFPQPALIEGSFDDQLISFVKNYPYRVAFNQFRESIVYRDQPGIPVRYRGLLKKMLFSPRYMFEGQWELTMAVPREDGYTNYQTFSGRWTMKQVKQ